MAGGGFPWNGPFGRSQEAASVESVNRALQQTHHRIDQQATTISNIGRQVTAMQSHLHHQALKEAIRENLREAQGYATFVMGAGYAGAFALWQMVKAELHPTVHALTGLSLGWSLAAYVAWEVYRMASTAFAQSAAHAQLGEIDSDAPSAQELLDRVERRHTVLWPMALAWSVYPALLAGAMLLGSLAYRLVQTL